MSEEQSSSPAAKRGRMGDTKFCGVCDSKYRDPKVLPCFHTFCARCIQDVADSHPRGTFPCPVCRTVIRVSPGEAASLVFSMDVQTGEPGRQNLCQTHNKELSWFCEECREAVCGDCKETRHRAHKTEGLTSAVSGMVEKLQTTDTQRLQQALNKVRERIMSLWADREAEEKRQSVLQGDVSWRFNIVQAAAFGQKEKALKCLQDEHEDLNSDIVCYIEEQEHREKQLSKLLRQVDNALNSATACDVIAASEEMTYGRGSPRAVKQLTSPVDRQRCRPVVEYDVSTDVMTQTVKDFVGNMLVVELSMRETGPDGRVTECVQGGEDPDTEVFCLCHDDSDPPGVWVSYERRGKKKEEDTPVKLFTETGKVQDIICNVGKLSHKLCFEGFCLCLHPQSGVCASYSKSLTDGVFKLYNDLSGQGQMERQTVISTDSFEIEECTEFTIRVGPHRTFDVDDAEQYVVVVEEAKDFSPWRSVHLYRRSVEDAVSTYSPPGGRYQPTDVCFYTLGGQQVLLITDQYNDAIHVVTIQRDRFQFEGYLRAAGPFLIDPTAISVDVHNRLWVGCRGGTVLLIEL